MSFFVKTNNAISWLNIFNALYTRHSLLAGGGGMECSIYQNYGAAEVMVQGLAGMVDQTDVEAIVRAQKKM